ncbi:DNA polymerase III subunit delta [Candidatus Uhrbacteria bacterium]|nr:DNA polymerase III subunit delta [Candidatus Uhrbacteria bacterium]
MLILIYGEDTYRSREWLRELISKFKAKFDAQGYNLSSFGDAVLPGELRAAIAAPPFLANRRMVVVSGLLLRSGTNELLEKVLAAVPDTSIVILWEEGDEALFAKVPLFAKLARKKEVKTYAFHALRGAALEAWAREESKKRSVVFERGALSALVRRVGSDLWQLSHELDKFAALREPVSAAHIAEHVHGTTPENIFGFIDAVVAHDSRRAIAALHNEREHGAAIPYLITMLVRQFRMLRMAHDYVRAHEGTTPRELAALFGWHPFVAKKVYAEVRAFERHELDHYSDAIFECDRGIKTGRYDAPTAFDLLIAKMLAVAA